MAQKAMTNKRIQIRAILGGVLLAVPYLLLFIAGSAWLYQNRMIVPWAGIALASTLSGWYLLRSLRHVASPPMVQPDLSWPPLGVDAWTDVEKLAATIEAENIPFGQTEKLVDIVRRVVDAVARQYHPEAAEPWLETPVPHLLRILELAARDLREATLSYLPGSHILTVGDLRRLQKLAGMANHSYFWYRIASFAINTPAAFLREGRDALFGKLKSVSMDAAKRWAVGYFVRRVGYYAIQLYGRHINLDDARPADAISKKSANMADDDVMRTAMLDREPLRILVVGQVKAGKSSLVNALFGEYRAATDVVPRTDRVEPYVLTRDGLEQAIVLDTAGYDAASGDTASGEQTVRALLAHLHGCDIVLGVCSAASAARQADRKFLDAIRAEFQRTPDRHMPIIVTALTHIDRLRPIAEWNPPYRLSPPEGPKAEQIAAAVETVASDLGLSAGDVIPVCLLPERIYNVEEALIPAILDYLPAAQRVKYVRCLRRQRDEEYWQRIWRQTVNAGRVLVGKLRGGR